MPGLPRKSTKKQLIKMMKKKGKKDPSNIKTKNIATYEQFLKINEGKYGKIEIWGQNDGEEAMLVAYAGSPEIAEDLERDFEDEFDKVWHQE